MPPSFLKHTGSYIYGYERRNFTWDRAMWHDNIFVRQFYDKHWQEYHLMKAG